MIRILIVDDQRLMADGLKTILELEEDMEILGIANNGQAAVEFCENNDIDLILMDVRMPNLNGVEATKIIKRQNENVKILILTTFDEDEYIIEGLANGASGYMLKDIDGDGLLNAIRSIVTGEYILPTKIAQKLAKNIQYKRKKVTGKHGLTEREIEIGTMLSEGFTNKQIASALYLSEGTIKNTISNIYSKIEISDRVAAAVYLKSILNIE